MKKPDSATTSGIRYFTGSIPMPLVETCEKIQIETPNGHRTIGIDDSYMGETVKDIFVKRKGGNSEFILAIKDGEINLNSDKVIGFKRRKVTESDILSQDLPECSNWDEDNDEDDN